MRWIHIQTRIRTPQRGVPTKTYIIRFGRNRILPAAAPRIATAETTDAEPRPAQNSVRLERLEKISRARRFETAAATRPGQDMKHRREEDLVAANKQTRQKKHQGARIEARSARRNHSSFSC
jgi:hypothetical protein